VTGPSPTDPDEKILRAVALRPAPFATAKEIEPELSVGYRQTRNRLDQLVDDGLMNVKDVGRTKVYWLSDAGRRRLEPEA
jgi:predicted ArsR family transcriptional regulator